MTKLSEIKRAAEALTPKQMIRLDAWLHELISAMRSKKLGGKRKEHKKAPKKTYQLESVRCGKKNCRCVEGELHGPYWYAYWTESGKSKSQYIGKKLPRGVKAPKGSCKRGVR
ncbi:MAG: DUF6788 family protein [Pyrinomonadaceae bacterium]